MLDQCFGCGHLAFVWCLLKTLLFARCVSNSCVFDILRLWIMMWCCGCIAFRFVLWPRLICVSIFKIVDQGMILWLFDWFCVPKYIFFVVQMEYFEVHRFNISCAGYSKPKILKLMVNKYSNIQNHVTYVGIIIKEGTWVREACVIIIITREWFVWISGKTHSLMNVKFVLNMMRMIWECDVILWNCFCEW